MRFSRRVPASGAGEADMDRTSVLVAGWLTVAAVAGTGLGYAQEQPKTLKELVTRLNVAGQGAGAWLEQLGVTSMQPPAERLLILTVTGGPLTERTGGASSVVIDADLDRLLRTPGMSAVLVHNHPSSVGLSAADIGQVAKPGVAAIVAIGPAGSV